HCGTVRLRVKLSGGGLGSPRRCNCSYCRMRGAVVVSASTDDLEVVSGAGALALYKFNTGVAEHHFCSRCGIYTHHRRRSNPDEYGVNVAILEGVSPFDFAEVPVTDGINHPSDGGSDGIVGTLRFVPVRQGG
ncbi:MAG TPA: GFA family protein, partial [Rhizobiaceae bacterium]